MIPFKIGNWEVTNDGIDWIGPSGKYQIEKSRINECGPGNRSKMYDWLVHMPTKGWLTVEDIYALNTAIIYALEAYGIGFDPKLSFVETLKEQQKMLSRLKE